MNVKTVLKTDFQVIYTGKAGKPQLPNPYFYTYLNITAIGESTTEACAAGYHYQFGNLTDVLVYKEDNSELVSFVKSNAEIGYTSLGNPMKFSDLVFSIDTLTRDEFDDLKATGETGGVPVNTFIYGKYIAWASALLGGATITAETWYYDENDENYVPKPVYVNSYPGSPEVDDIIWWQADHRVSSGMLKEWDGSTWNNI
jgi:hypothetical protein